MPLPLLPDIAKPLGVAIAIILLTAGCSAKISTRGNLVADDALKEIEIGKSTKEQIAKELGTPSTIATFDGNTWYYIGAITETISLFPQNTIDQKIITMKFDGAGILRALDYKNKEDANVVAIVDRTTVIPSRDLTIIQQILGNVGRFPTGSGPASNTPGRGGPGN